MCWKKTDTKVISNSKFSVDISVSSANIFFMADKKGISNYLVFNVLNYGYIICFKCLVCLMMRVDSSSIESRSWPSSVSMLTEGTKFSSITPSTATYVCLRSKDIKVFGTDF